jgi:MoaA/NifB/PqqE/SkfB family radical SAM enzyme
MSSDELRLNQKNKYRALWEFARGVANVATTPPTLQIARTNICNFRCVYCTDHRAGNNIPRTKNEGETWQRLLQLIPRSETLSFHGISEFMIDPEFFDIVRRCTEAEASLFINTNGSVCGERHLDALVNYKGYLSMNFSLDAATPETFKRIRGRDFERIIRNIKTYVERFEPRRDQTWISLSFVITKSNVHEMATFVSLAKELKANAIKFYRLHELAEQFGLYIEIPARVMEAEMEEVAI